MSGREGFLHPTGGQDTATGHQDGDIGKAGGDKEVMANHQDSLAARRQFAHEPVERELMSNVLMCGRLIQ